MNVDKNSSTKAGNEIISHPRNSFRGLLQGSLPSVQPYPDFPSISKTITLTLAAWWAVANITSWAWSGGDGSIGYDVIVAMARWSLSTPSVVRAISSPDGNLAGMMILLEFGVKARDSKSIS